MDKTMRASQSIARIWAADIRSQSSSGEPSSSHRNRDVCVLPSNAGQLLRSPLSTQAIISVPVGGCRTQPPT
ncbi:hypothetical protein [Xanthomonas phaseoli]|uniref:hypothetical protein n=1 Tax=Xanthomonas phaseoli TaxID=1985254 RepID=UPI001E389C6A|nr:hypothetical protein [Xanthomonas phaseoli]MCC8470827.1 hypothetical protein [Xanthomonas phaseoli]